VLAILATPIARFTVATVPDARPSLYPDSGHSPFCEEPARFNRELTEFMRQVSAAR
jgi:pimeloyl-ACP methyl ester carboxylesterase